MIQTRSCGASERRAGPKPECQPLSQHRLEHALSEATRKRRLVFVKRKDVAMVCFVVLGGWCDAAVGRRPGGSQCQSTYL